MKATRVSKTMWFNGVAFILAVLIAVLEGQGFTGELPAEWALFVLPVVTGVNLVLRRFYTNTALGA